MSKLIDTGHCFCALELYCMSPTTNLLFVYISSPSVRVSPPIHQDFIYHLQLRLVCKSMIYRGHQRAVSPSSGTTHFVS